MARWQLMVVVARERHADITLRFDHTPITIGGAAGSDVVLGGPHVSRTHAIVTVSGGRVVYQDRSSNGSFVDDRRITEVTLAPDDAVVVPPYVMKFGLTEQADQVTVPLPPPPGGDVPWTGPQPQEQRSTSSGGAVSPVADDARQPDVAFTLRLVQAPGPLMDRSYTFATRPNAQGIIVGRTADADVCIDIPSVSRQHAEISATSDGRWQVSDRGSRNGIAVNGVTTSSALLQDGDRVAFGPDVTALFVQPSAPSPPTTPDDRGGALATGAHVGDGDLRVSERRSMLDDEVLVLAIHGRIDGYNYTEFRERLNHAIEAGSHRLVLDFTECGFCDHAGLGVVLSVKTTLDKHKGRLCLIGVDERLRQGLSLLRLDTLLAVEPDEEAAVARLVRR